MFSGSFLLHIASPFFPQVQVIYQTCEVGQSSEATCNCGVAVRSGDDVFVAERCRRDDGADQPLRSQLYLNGELTQGTFIFSEYEGQRFHVSILELVYRVSLYKICILSLALIFSNVYVKILQQCILDRSSSW